MAITKTEETPNFNEKDFQFILFYMGQAMQEIRHTESLRERLTGLSFTIAALISGFVIQQGSKPNMWIMCVVLVFLGLFGVLATRKLYQLYEFDQFRLNEWYKYLESKGIDNEIFVARERADKMNCEKYTFMCRFRHNWLWQIMNFSISIIGTILLFMISG